MNGTAALSWPASRAAEGLELLARAAGIATHPRQTPAAHRAPATCEEALLPAAAALGLDVEAVETTFGDVDVLLRRAGPAVIRIDGDALIMLVRRRGRGVTVVRPDHHVATVPLDLVRRALVEPAAAPLRAEAERLVEETGVRPSSRPRVVRALVSARLRARKLQAGWLVRIPSTASFRQQLVAVGARRRFILLAAAHAAQYACWILAWWLLGRSALRGHLDPAWLGAWTLALFSLIGLQLAALWLQGTLAIGVGALLKQRLLAGAFRLEPEETRKEGAGQLLGRVIEAEAVGSLATSGGFLALLATLELGLAAGVLALAAPLLSVLLLTWSVLTLAIGAVYFGRRFRWVSLRVGLTHDLIERMVGHRTRAAQQPPEEWHHGEDEALERYVRASAGMDQAGVWLHAIIPRGWMVVGLAGLTPLFIGQGSPESMAVGLGGILLAFRALDRLTAGVWSLAGAAIAWRQVSPVFRAASRGTLAAAPAARPDAATTGDQPVLEATDLRFAHSGRAEPVLQGCSLAIAAGERIILQGPSGGGKSTLASLLAGLRTPQSGLILIDGLDLHTLGLAGWRRRVVLVPQFHENHLLLGTVAFNLLMGVEWPPGEEDFVRADGVLRELGLGDTLDRMPSGLLQTIGETGWQLSHGERSRLYLARALLQKPDVLILDESFAQLDPENMHLALNAVVARSPAVLLIAHP